MNKKKNKLKSLKDMPQKSQSFFLNHQVWFSNMFGAFVATVLGIAVTLGVSKCSDYYSNKEVIKASVFNALSDLDNYEDYLKKEYSDFSQFDWLKNAIDSFYQDSLIQKDPLAEKIKYSFGLRNRYKKYYSPIGKDFLNQCQIRSVDDLETFRIINIAYDDAYHSYAYLKEMIKCVDDLNDVWLGMYYSPVYYSSSDVVEKILSRESAPKLCLMMNEKFLVEGEELGFFDYYIKVIDSHRQRILLFAGTDMEEYMEFKRERRKKEVNNTKEP